MRREALLEALRGEKGKKWMEELYAEKAGEGEARYLHVAEGFTRRFGDREFELFSSPGRSEIGGNHTDHNHGKVLAASINLDCIAAAAKCDGDLVTVVSEGYPEITVSIKDLEPDGETMGTRALLRGILAGFRQRGYQAGGFVAYVTSTVISAAGVSSSAAFEMLICSMVDYFYNEGRVGVVNYAHIGKYAENLFWKKQSGLLDQMSCAVGGLVTMDFQDPEQPQVERLDFTFSQIGYELVIVNTGKGHADLSEEYSSIPREMKQAAVCLGGEVLAQTSLEEVLNHVDTIRTEAGDRALLRALHFFAENRRVEAEVAAIQEGDYDRFLRLISQSGDSSWKWLQNCYPTGAFREQAVTVALALTELYLEKIGAGVCRVHGGGFAGVIMVVIPREQTKAYIEYIESKIGRGNAYVMNIRKHGAVRLDLD